MLVAEAKSMKKSKVYVHMKVETVKQKLHYNANYLQKLKNVWYKLIFSKFVCKLLKLGERK